MALMLGALLDGIPESAAIGASLLGRGGVSAAMVAAVFLSNVPESLSATAGPQRPPGLGDTMVPEATEHAGRLVGLMLMAGFTAAFLLSHA